MKTIREIANELGVDKQMLQSFTAWVLMTTKFSIQAEM